MIIILILFFAYRSSVIIPREIYRMLIIMFTMRQMDLACVLM